jgi:hypothetical protein
VGDVGVVSDDWEDSDDSWKGGLAIKSDVQGSKAMLEAIERSLDEGGYLDGIAEEKAQPYIDALWEIASRPKPDSAAELESEDGPEVDSFSEMEQVISKLIRREPLDTEAPGTGNAEAASESDPESAAQADLKAADPSGPLFVRSLRKMLSARQEAHLDRMPEEIAAESELLESIEERSTEAEDVATPSTTASAPTPEIYGLLLTVSNKINGETVPRPSKVGPGHNWKVEYELSELPEKRLQSIFEAIKARQSSAFSEAKKAGWKYNNEFFQDIGRWNDRGKAFRKREDERNRKMPVHILGDEKPKAWDEVFQESTKAEEVEE